MPTKDTRDCGNATTSFDLDARTVFGVTTQNHIKTSYFIPLQDFRSTVFRKSTKMF